METPIEVDDQNQEENQWTCAKNDTVNEHGKEEFGNNDESARKTRSIVWEHFKYVKGATKFECPYCKEKLKYISKNGTQGLKNHLENVCRTSPLLKKKKGDMRKQSVLNFKPSVKGEGSLTAHSFNAEKCRNALARMCIKDNRPFSVVDDEGFQEYSLELNPLFKLPSRWTVARECLAIYKKEANVIKKLLENQTISLTTDTWSSCQNINYMCLTGHWVDDEWILRKKILNFCPIANHKGETIGKLVYGCLQKWGIERVFTVTVDNASSNDGAIRILKTMLRGPNAIMDCRYMHLRCCAHIINLVVRDGLDEQDESIAKIRNAVRYVRSSPARAARFRECVEKVKVDCNKKPCLDVETRWNSTFLMLETAIQYVDAFDRMNMIDNQFKAYLGGGDEDECESNTRKRKRKDIVVGPPEASDWENARQFLEYLRVFYDVTNLISGSKYVTSNMFFSKLVTMHASISQMCNSVDEKKKKMAISMKAKYDKYWENMDNMNFLLYVAVVLDPRNKMCFLEWCLEQIYGIGSPKTKQIRDRVIKTLNDLFDHYKLKAEKVGIGSKGQSSYSNSTKASSSINTDIKINLESSFLKYLEEHGGVTNKSEVEIYLSDGMENRDERFDTLNWWKTNSLKFPILSQVARHVLGMPISTVASESAFSTGGRVIDPFRSSLTPKTAEALICAQDWIRSTPTDIELPDVHAKAIEELQDKLEKIELDAFESGPKFFAPCMIDD